MWNDLLWGFDEVVKWIHRSKADISSLPHYLFETVSFICVASSSAFHPLIIQRRYFAVRHLPGCVVSTEGVLVKSVHSITLWIHNQINNFVLNFKLCNYHLSVVSVCCSSGYLSPHLYAHFAVQGVSMVPLQIPAVALRYCSSLGAILRVSSWLLYNSFRRPCHLFIHSSSTSDTLPWWWNLCM